MAAKPKDSEALTKQVRASFAGHTHIVTKFIADVNEYNSRQRLLKIGYSDSLGDLSDRDATIFLEISCLYDKLELDKLKKDQKRR